MRECNILVSDSTLEVGVDSVRCNLVVAFDPPESFRSFLQYKVKAKAASAWILLFEPDPGPDPDPDGGLINKLALYQVLERKLKARCAFQGIRRLELTGTHKDWMTILANPDSQGQKVPAIASRDSILLLNKYCAKLPSDTL